MRARLARRLTSGGLGARLASGAFWSTAGALVSRSLMLAAAILSARLLGQSEFGKFGTIQGTIGLFAILAAGGLTLTATKHVAEFRTANPTRAGRYIALCMATAFLMGVPVTLAIFLLSPWLTADLLRDATLLDKMQWASLLVLLGALNGIQQGVAIGLEDFGSMALMNITRSLLFLGAVCAGAYFAGLLGATVGQLLAEGISFVVNGLLLNRACRRAAIPLNFRALHWAEFPALARFALPALLAGMATQPATWLSTVLLVNQPNGFAALAIFNAADRWRQLILFLPTSVSAIILPMLANLHGQHDPAGFRKVFRLNLALNLGVIALTALGLILFSRQAMAIYGGEYEGGWLTLCVLAVTAIFTVLNSNLGQVLVSVGHIWWRFAFDVALGLLLIAFSLWLIPAYRDEGMALANLAAFGGTVALLAVTVNRYFAGRREGGDGAHP